jgi:MFS family permease
VPLTLPAIMHHYDIGSQSSQWVLNASLVSLAALLVFGGELGDQLGRRRVFIVGTITFAAASACAAVAPTFWLLILCRAIQGAGGLRCCLPRSHWSALPSPAHNAEPRSARWAA